MDKKVVLATLNPACTLFNAVRKIMATAVMIKQT
jgi:hypothetical protein